MGKQMRKDKKQSLFPTKEQGDMSDICISDVGVWTMLFVAFCEEQTLFILGYK